MVRNLRRRNRIDLEIVKRTDDLKGFVVLPCRWVVERIFAWLSFNRRLSKLRVSAGHKRNLYSYFNDQACSTSMNVLLKHALNPELLIHAKANPIDIGGSNLSAREPR